MKRIIKLINNERKNAKFCSQKGCDATSTYECISIDAARCLIYAYDKCSKDYEACMRHAEDVCLYIDDSGLGCTGNLSSDYCISDYT